MQKNLAAVVIVTNGPGELATWVKPVVNHLKSIFDNSSSHNQTRFSLRVALVPCPNATGNESLVAKNWNQLDLVTPAKVFWKLLLNPALFAKWPKKGVVVFLGGDQLWSVLLAKRLGYHCITYAEWTARWPQYNLYIAAMNEKVKAKLPKKYHKNCLVIGDLMADIKNHKTIPDEIINKKWIAILPGSKKAKLSVGIPYFLEVVDLISTKRKDVHFIIPLALTTSIEDFMIYQSDKNPISKYYSSKIKSIHKQVNSIFDFIIETTNNSKIYILTKHPNHHILSHCKIALTTVGANTAELAAINLPMLVVLPIQHLHVMTAWDGIFGILSKISFINKFQAFLISKWYLKTKKFFSWPNIKANKLIVPERIGKIPPKDIANEALFLLENENLLQDQKSNLSKARGKDGAVKKLSDLIVKTLNYQGSSISND